MKFHVLTLFPEMVMQGLHTSIIGRAVEKELISIEAVNIRDYTQDKHGKVDDYTYGGGAGMLMQAQPVFDAWKSVCGEKKLRTIYVTPQGHTFNQKLAMDLAKEEELVFLCGHYEGIDERVLEEVVTDYISIGDYVLTGGELPAMVMIDAISRLVPGVLNNDASAHTESFHNDLLEYPQYSRPEEWHGKRVPDVLLSGNHSKIVQWRLERSKEKTERVRPDLYQKYLQKEKLIQKLSKNKRNNIHMIESLARGNSEILYAKDKDILLYDGNCKVCMLSAETPESGATLIKRIPEDTTMIVASQQFLNSIIVKELGFQIYHECFQACYTKREALPVKYKDIRPLTLNDVEYVVANYHTERAYIVERIQSKCMYGAYVEDKLVGFVGVHDDGGMGMLFVEEAYRGSGIGSSLEAYNVNRQREAGYIPYANIVVDNALSIKLQEKLGLYLSKDTVWWTGK